MLCQNCNKKIATVKLTQVLNNFKEELYLCATCAKEKGSFNIGSPFSINDFFSGLMDIQTAGPYTDEDRTIVTCPKCGMTIEEFQKIGKFGCEKCYSAFEDQVKPLVKRLHGSSSHTGKAPAKNMETPAPRSELELLKEDLNVAIKHEEYEKAAQIRDRIKAMEGGN